jgi:hypothetical protein
MTYTYLNRIMFVYTSMCVYISIYTYTFTGFKDFYQITMAISGLSGMDSI